MGGLKLPRYEDIIASKTSLVEVPNQGNLHSFPCPHCGKLIPVKVEVQTIGMKITVPRNLVDKVAGLVK